MNRVINNTLTYHRHNLSTYDDHSSSFSQRIECIQNKKSSPTMLLSQINTNRIVSKALILISVDYLKNMTRLYSQWLQQFPLPTKAITSGVLFSIGDALTQKFVENKGFSWKRNIDFFIVGMTYMGPVLHFWYSKWLPTISAKLFSQTASKAVKVIGSMTFQQLCFSPILMSLFYPVNQIVSQRNPKAFGRGIQAWKGKIVETMQANWKVWPLATTINLWFMPIQYQVLFANCVALFYNMFLSYIASR